MSAPATPVRLQGPPGSAAVAAGSREVVAAALEVLARGGSAVDAAVAGAMAAVVSEPVLASLGGGGFVLVGGPEDPPQALDFFVDVPGQGLVGDAVPDVRTVIVDFARTGTAAGNSEQVFHGGWGTVAVPGCLDGLLQAHERWGRLDREEIVAPAARLARSGAEISTGQRVFLHLVTDLLNLTEDSRAIFAEVERTGRYRNDAYGGLLDAVASGAVRGIASPAFAEPLLAAAVEGGLLTSADLSAYRPMVREPLHASRSGAQVWTNPSPSVGGSIVLAALALIAVTPGRFDPGAAVDALVSATTAQRRRGTVKTGTTHLSVLDGDGRLAALTLSNGSGSGTVVPHWGVALNNMLGEEDLRPADGHALRPGERMGSMMAPTLVRTTEGGRIALGTGGSERIRSAVLSVLLRLIDQGLPLADAVGAARVHASETGPVHAEPGWSVEDRERMAEVARARGWSGVETWSAANLFFGGVHAVEVAPDGTVDAVGDSRRTGSVGILRPDGSTAQA